MRLYVRVCIRMYTVSRKHRTIYDAATSILMELIQWHFRFIVPQRKPSARSPYISISVCMSLVSARMFSLQSVRCIVEQEIIRYTNTHTRSHHHRHHYILSQCGNVNGIYYTESAMKTKNTDAERRWIFCLLELAAVRKPQATVYIILRITISQPFDWACAHLTSAQFTWSIPHAHNSSPRKTLYTTVRTSYVQCITIDAAFFLSLNMFVYSTIRRSTQHTRAMQSYTFNAFIALSKLYATDTFCVRISRLFYSIQRCIYAFLLRIERNVRRRNRADAHCRCNCVYLPFCHWLNDWRRRK